MSNPPASASLPLSSSKKKVRSTPTNVSKKLLMELQALIAFASYDSPSLAGGGNSFTEVAMEKLMATLCFGDGDVRDSETMSYVDQFLAGLNRFKGLFTASPASEDQHESPLILSIPVLLHRQSGIHIYIGSGSIEKELLCSKSLVNSTQISGRTMLRFAKDVLSNCKKMMALVTRSDSPYKDINYTPSGTNYEDYVKWCLSAMYNAEQNAEKARSKYENKNKKILDALIKVLHSTIFLTALLFQVTTGNLSNNMNSSTNNNGGNSTNGNDNHHDDDNMDSLSPEEVPYPSSANNNGIDNHEVEVPRNYFFKGFLAWCLWGWIPIVPGSTMKSFLFSDGKCSTSFGRKIASRQVMKSKSASSAAAAYDVERTPKKQKQQKGREQMEMGLLEKQKHMNVLEKTYKLFEAELFEKELQNTHHLELRIVRDNLASLNKRHDRLLERYYRTQNGPMQAEIKENLDRYENEMLELETNIKKLQEAEVGRRKNVLLFRQAAAAAVSFGTISGGTEEPPRVIDCSETLRTTSPATTFFSVPLPEVDEAPVCDASIVCIECRKNPSTHKHLRAQIPGLKV